MNNFEASLWTLILLSFLQVIQGSAQFSSSASFKPLSSALNINQTRLQGSTNPLQSSQNDRPSTTSSQPSSISSPICLQPRSPTDPNAATFQSSAASNNSISKACNPSNRHTSTIPWAHTFYALNSTYYFNTSLQNLPILSTPNRVPSGASGVAGSQDCSNSFRAILSSCTTALTFWGGWMEKNGVNYTSK